MLGYAHFRTPPVPAPFTLDAEKGDYCRMDVQFLSDWLLKITGSGADCFYLAVGADETLRILSMNDVIYEELAASMGTDSTAPAVTVDGIIKPMTPENMEAVMDTLDLTEAQYTALVGSNYLDLRNDPNGDLVHTFVYVLGASLVLLLIDAAVALDDRHERRGQRTATAPDA